MFKRLTFAYGAVALAIGAALAFSAIAADAAVTYHLYAKAGRISTPDGNSIYFWGFALNDGLPQLPGPTLRAAEGEVVEIVLHNSLPTTVGEPVSLMFPGQDVAPTPTYSGSDLTSFASEVAPGGTPYTYSFTAAHPGTFMYYSGTNPQKQVPLGLYGAIIVSPAFDTLYPGRHFAYDHLDTEFDRDYLLIASEIDPELNEAVGSGQPFDFSKYHPRYFAFNGRCFPDTMAGDNVSYLPYQPYGSLIMMEPGDRVLIRYVGAGLQNHLLHPHGNHTRVVGQDGRLLKSGPGLAVDLSYRWFTAFLGAGQTYDEIYTWTGLGYSEANPLPVQQPDARNLVIMSETMYSGSPYLGVKGELPVGVVSHNMAGEYYFMLHAHEEPKITNWGEFPGGLMTHIAVFAPGTMP